MILLGSATHWKGLQVVVEEAVDGGLKDDDGSEDATLQPPFAQRGEVLSHEEDVGLKWKVQCG
jgi:hypothetical protein